MINPKLFFALVLLAFIIIVPTVSAANVTHQMPASQNLTVNKTFTLDSGGSTPALMWLGAIALGIILVLLSFFPFPGGEEGLISIGAWIPIAYAMYTAMKVDVITNAGTVISSAGVTQVESHTIYQFNTEAMLLLVLLAAAIGNTYRIWVSQKKLRELSGSEPEAFDY
jgi:hypothetical protein